MLARQHLERQGLQMLTSNYRCRMGEIDLIMVDRDSIVFVEVRFRTQIEYGTAAASVTYPKQRRLIKAAELFLLRNAQLKNRPCRFDVVGIDLAGPEPGIQWITDAFRVN
jgi:putative endonuclease